MLASASPRRQNILREAGMEFIVRVSDAEAELGAEGSGGDREGADAREGPGADVCFALRAARMKALDVAGRNPGWLVVGADTVVAVGHNILGKPQDTADAARMLRGLSGRAHRVSSALAIVYNNGEGAAVVAEDYETSKVVFKELTEQEIADYVSSGEPMDKAGAYAVQALGRELVEKVEGSFLNVVGLPIAKLQSMLEKVGWRPAEHTED